MCSHLNCYIHTKRVSTAGHASDTPREVTVSQKETDSDQTQWSDCCRYISRQIGKLSKLLLVVLSQVAMAMQSHRQAKHNRRSTWLSQVITPSSRQTGKLQQKANLVVSSDDTIFQTDRQAVLDGKVQLQAKDAVQPDLAPLVQSLLSHWLPCNKHTHIQTCDT